MAQETWAHRSKIEASKALLAGKDSGLSIKAVELNEAKIVVDNEERARKNAEEERGELRTPSTF